MRTIWKYPLARRGWNPVEVGPDAKVVLAALDHATKAPTIWVEHERPKEPTHSQGVGIAHNVVKLANIRYFRVAVTDDDIEESEIHVGSMIDGIYVWHIYERGPV